MANADRSFDLVVVGSGPGGYVCAVRGAQLGLRTAVIEKDPLPGGTCLHWGCIPTKALLHSAEVLETARHAARFGIEVSEPRLDLERVQAYKDKVVQSNARGVQFLFKKNGVTSLRGYGRLAGGGHVEITPEDGEPYTVRGKAIVLATGSAIRGLPGVAFDGRRVLHSDDALALRAVPKSMIVLGAGAVGVEFASIYASFGSKVTVVELLARMLPLEDSDLGAEIERAFRKRGIDVHTGARVESVQTSEDGVRIRAAQDGTAVELSAETLLVAVGRKPRTDDLGLERTAVKLDARGFVEVDVHLRTAEPGVYAIGDILPTQALAHVASHEGVNAAEHAAGKDPHAIDYDKVPSCTYCDPEVAAVGLTEEEARRRGHDVVVGTFPFSAIGKAKILSDARGFVKIVAERRHDEILGVHIIGPHATELISEATAALALEATAASLIEAIHAHPTLAEAMHEAALGVHGRSIHI